MQVVNSDADLLSRHAAHMASRVLRCGFVLKSSTLLHFHHVLTKRKYRMLFSSQRGRRLGPKGPANELIHGVVGIKRRNPTWGCPRIASWPRGRKALVWMPTQ